MREKVCVRNFGNVVATGWCEELIIVDFDALQAKMLARAGRKLAPLFVD